MNTMTAEHPRWEEFEERLEGPEGCNFQEDENEETTWQCKGGTDKSKATAILIDMEMDVSTSLSYFESNGGYCDCEILFNISPLCMRGG